MWLKEGTEKHKKNGIVLIKRVVDAKLVYKFKYQETQKCGRTWKILNPIILI